MTALIISNSLLWLLVVTMACIIFAPVRQIGVLYERIAPAGALALIQTLQVGMDAPEIPVTPLQGNLNRIGGRPGTGRASLLFNKVYFDANSEFQVGDSTIMEIFREANVAFENVNERNEQYRTRNVSETDRSARTRANETNR